MSCLIIIKLINNIQDCHFHFLLILPCDDGYLQCNEFFLLTVYANGILIFHVVKYWITSTLYLYEWHLPTMISQSAHMMYFQKSIILCLVIECKEKARIIDKISFTTWMHWIHKKHPNPQYSDSRASQILNNMQGHRWTQQIHDVLALAHKLDFLWHFFYPSTYYSC